MHELGITQNIVAIVSESARGASAKRVTLEIGQLSAILLEAIRFCFDICCQGTELEGATLEIRETGCNVVQINIRTGCHLEAEMVAKRKS